MNVNKKLNELKDKIKDEVTEMVTEEVKKKVVTEEYKNFQDSIKETVSEKINEILPQLVTELNQSTERSIDGFTNVIIETFSTKLEEATNKNFSLNEELINVKHSLEEHTIELETLKEESERLSLELEEKVESYNKIVEDLTVERDKALSEFENINVSNEVYKLLDENVSLRLISEQLRKCQTIEELNLIVKIFNEGHGEVKKALSSAGKGKGTRFLKEEIEEEFLKDKSKKKEYTNEQKVERGIAGLDNMKGEIKNG